MMLESKYKHYVSFHVEGRPPWKANPGLSKQRYAPVRKEAVNKLQREAFHVREREEEIFFADKVALAIRYCRVKSERDAANIVSGIADALQGILYKNDSALVEIHYLEEPSAEGAKDEYWVEVAKVE